MIRPPLRRGLEQLEQKLLKTEIERESYRLFIQQSGQIKDYMIWWAKQQGFKSAFEGPPPHG